jgi:hypothetical protein
MICVVPLRKEYDTMRVVWNENNTEVLNLKDRPRLYIGATFVVKVM